jgi:hypothetical protein
MPGDLAVSRGEDGPIFSVVIVTRERLQVHRTLDDIVVELDAAFSRKLAIGRSESFPVARSRNASGGARQDAGTRHWRSMTRPAESSDRIAAPAEQRPQRVARVGTDVGDECLRPEAD